MKIAKDCVVKINYVLKDKDGNQIDASNGEPLEYIHGNNNLIIGLENKLEGHDPGDKFLAEVEPELAYGKYDENLLIELPREQFDTDMQIEVGMKFQAMGPMGPVLVSVAKVEGDKITIDSNHELAGKKLFFDVEVVEVRQATLEEIESLKQAASGGCGGGCGGCGGSCGSEGGCAGGGCGGGCGCN
ncbi:MAG: peptidylprolyl isomerase [Treponema sp.]|nr:peptidylprolyl isomerase [Treponema sp.]